MSVPNNIANMLSRFHEHYGSSIFLLDDNTVAHRTSSYSNGITFSENPLLPGEIFLIEIEKIEPGWSGNLRLGLTMFNIDDNREVLPEYALPDYLTAGAFLPSYSLLHTTWAFPIREYPNHPASDEVERNHYHHHYQRDVYVSINVLGRGQIINTPRGSFPRTALKSRINPNVRRRGLQVSVLVGSRIGVMYVPCIKVTPGEPDLAMMHFIIDGYDVVASSKKIPYKKGNLHAIVDVYGTTKQIKIVQLYGGKFLST